MLAAFVESSPGSLWGDYVRTLAVLAAVCLAAVFAVRVWLPRLAGNAGASGPKLLEVLARQPLEPRKTLYLVRAGKSVLVLAASGDAVRHMATLDGAEFPEAPSVTEPGKSVLFGQIARMVRERGGAR